MMKTGDKLLIQDDLSQKHSYTETNGNQSKGRKRKWKYDQNRVERTHIGRKLLK